MAFFDTSVELQGPRPVRNCAISEFAIAGNGGGEWLVGKIEQGSASFNHIRFISGGHAGIADASPPAIFSNLTIASSAILPDRLVLVTIRAEEGFRMGLGLRVHRLMSYLGRQIVIDVQ